GLIRGSRFGVQGSRFQRHFIPARVRDCPNARQTKQQRVAASGQCPAGSHASHCIMNATSHISQKEWLEADGLGGFASGTSTGIRTRRYHALLLPATTPPTGRVVLANAFDAWVETANGAFMLSSQCYAPDVIGGDGSHRIDAFGSEPWPQ